MPVITHIAVPPVSHRGDRRKPKKRTYALTLLGFALTVTTLFVFGINRDEYTSVSRMQLGLEADYGVKDTTTAVPTTASGNKKKKSKSKKKSTKGMATLPNPEMKKIIWSPPEDFKLTPLRQIDIEQYTVRINSWKRQEQLEVTIHHYLTCEGVAQIQIVWCDAQGPPSASLLELAEKNSDRLVFEHHDLNSLNERFRVLIPTPTLGVMHVDDDILRSCEAMDAGFFKWTQAPHRMVGYDVRGHGSSGRWIDPYGYQVINVRGNREFYSMALTKFCFTHRDYLDAYMQYMPKQLLDRIADSLNCEDIAMTLFISALTHGQVPLLADIWALDSFILMHSEITIGNGGSHFTKRHECVRDFTQVLGLQDESGPRYLAPTKLKYPDLPHARWMHAGAHVIPEDNTLVSSDLVKGERQIRFEAMIEAWMADHRQKDKDISKFRKRTEAEARSLGFIERSEEWRERQRRLKAEKGETAQG